MNTSKAPSLIVRYVEEMGSLRLEMNDPPSRQLVEEFWKSVADEKGKTSHVVQS